MDFLLRADNKYMAKPPVLGLAIGLVLLLSVPTGSRTAGSNAIPVRSSGIVLPSCAPGRPTVLAPPASGAYHSAYFSPTNNEITVTDQSITNFESLAQKNVALVVFSNPWGLHGRVDIDFPKQQVETVWAHGSIPYLRFQPWTKEYWRPRPDPVVTMQKVIDGTWDRQILAWMRAAKATGIPMLVEFGVEVNGSWFPWSGRWNGGGQTSWRNPSLPDGPERYRDAYRHVIDLSRRAHVTNITWGFHVDAWAQPHHAWWNRMRYYYPGNSYIDWLGISAYGEQVPTSDPSNWYSFRQVLGSPANPKSPWSEFAALAPSKPHSIAEFGVTEDPSAGDKAQWITDAFGAIASGYYPGVKLESYWSESWPNGGGKPDSELQIDSSPSSLSAYRSAVASPSFVATPTFVCR